jgi:hypothetical protein
MAARNGPDHALAHGVVFSIANDRSFGKDTPPAQRVLAPQPLFLANRCYADTGLTTADFATTFGGESPPPRRRSSAPPGR